MNTRYAVPVLCAAAIVFACGPRPRATADAATSASTTAPAPVMKAEKPDTVHPLKSALEVTRRDGKATFALRLANKGKKAIELAFSSGQTHDFVVMDANGRELWRWSDDRMFTQAMQTKVLQMGEETAYSETWTPTAAQRGTTLTVVATLNSTNHTVEQRAEFVVP